MAGKYIVSVIIELLKNLVLNKLSKEIATTAVRGAASISKLFGNIGLFFILCNGRSSKTCIY
jgi:hypothetical protein